MLLMSTAGSDRAVGEFRFCFTLDTEPDDLWSDQQALRFDSFDRLPHFHGRLLRAGARPTYLTTSEVAQSEQGRRALRQIQDTGIFEIGAHFHTWTRSWPFDTPSFDDPRLGRLKAFAHQLEQPVEEQMLAYTCEVLHDELEVRPVSHRGGRWALGPTTPLSLANCNIEVDSTVTPGLDWRSRVHPWLNGPDFSDRNAYPYYLTVPGTGGPDARETAPKPALEIPVGGAFVPAWTREVMRYRVPRLLTRVVRRFSPRPCGHVWLRPTSMSVPYMAALLRQLKRDGVPVWVMMIHSSEIVPCSKMKTEADCLGLMSRCLEIVRVALELGAAPATLSEAGNWLRSTRYL